MTIPYENVHSMVLVNPEMIVRLYKQNEVLRSSLGFFLKRADDATRETYIELMKTGWQIEAHAEELLDD